jgi:hypothetical protein
MMKRIAILAAIAVAGMTAAGLSAQPGPPPGGRPAGGGLPGIGATEQVSANVYKIFGAGGNTTAFVRSDGVVLVVASVLAFTRRRWPAADKWIVLGGSTVVIAAGSYWFVERVFFGGI